MILKALRRIGTPSGHTLEPGDLLHVYGEEEDILWANYDCPSGKRTMGISRLWIERGYVKRVNEKPTVEEQEQWLDLLT